jgi:hypothetical protein
MGKQTEPRLCPNCPFTPLFLHEVKKESWLNDNDTETANTTLKLCSRMRALARQHGILHECKHFNYGLDQPPQRPTRTKEAKQTTL